MRKCVIAAVLLSSIAAIIIVTIYSTLLILYRVSLPRSRRPRLDLWLRGAVRHVRLLGAALVVRVIRHPLVLHGRFLK